MDFGIDRFVQWVESRYGKIAGGCFGTLIALAIAAVALRLIWDNAIKPIKDYLGNDGAGITFQFSEYITPAVFSAVFATICVFIAGRLIIKFMFKPVERRMSAQIDEFNKTIEKMLEITARAVRAQKAAKIAAEDAQRKIDEADKYISGLLDKKDERPN